MPSLQQTTRLLVVGFESFSARGVRGGVRGVAGVTSDQAHLREPLVAEFAVQTVPTLYARAVASGSDGPDLILTQLSEATVEAIQTLRSGSRSAELPVVVVAGTDRAVDPGPLFGAGADDLL